MRSNFSTVENYFKPKLEAQLPSGFESFRQASDDFKKTGISLAPLEATILQTLVRAHQGSKWIEIGTLTGFSGFCISRTLMEKSSHTARLWTFEKDPSHAARARDLFEQKGLAQNVTVIEGDAAIKLATIAGEAPFDGLFIDGNKGAYLTYLEWSIRHLKPGAMVVADNVFLGGAIWENSVDNVNNSIWSASVVERMRKFLDLLFDTDRFQSCLIPTAEGMAVGVFKG